MINLFAFIFKPLLAPAINFKLLKHPTLLPGEKILLQQDATCVETYLTPVKGTLHLTTFRVIFSGSVLVCSPQHHEWLITISISPSYFKNGHILPIHLYFTVVRKKFINNIWNNKILGFPFSLKSLNKEKHELSTYMYAFLFTWKIMPCKFSTRSPVVLQFGNGH